ncbi:MAG: MaoC family dehydratase, partial [Pseudomonadota bacterium]
PDTATASINYGFDRVRFIAPVRSGTRLRARFRLRRVESGDGTLTLTLTAQMEGDGMERPALIADWIVRLSVT